MTTRRDLPSTAMHSQSTIYFHSVNGYCSFSYHILDSIALLHCQNFKVFLTNKQLSKKLPSNTSTHLNALKYQDIGWCECDTFLQVLIQSISQIRLSPAKCNGQRRNVLYTLLTYQFIHSFISKW